MAWKIITTKSFSKVFKKHKKNGEFISALEKKFNRFKEEIF
jgi:hypothetical protein